MPDDMRVPSMDLNDPKHKQPVTAFSSCAFAKRWHEKAATTQASELGEEICHRCNGSFSKETSMLSGIKVGGRDCLELQILQVYLSGEDYKIYRTSQGVGIYFSDCRHREREQRKQYAAVFGRICQLRFLTSQMLQWPFNSRQRRRSGGYYDHQIAEAIYLTMEGKPNRAREILDSSLKSATDRVTNENRVRYLVSCLWVALTLCLIYLTWVRWNLTFSTLSGGQSVGLAAVAGALGAVFSIATRIQDLELHPCQQSMMNYFMGGLRVFTGFSAGAVIMLITSGTILGGAITPLFEGPSAAPNHWRGFVLLGFLGGFAERVVPLLLGKLEGRVEGSSADERSEATGEK